MSGSIRVNPQKMRELAKAVFMAKDLPEQDAEEIADCLVEANLTGKASHGLLRIKCYVSRLDRGGVDPHGKARTVFETPTTAVLDAGNAMGMVTGRDAAQLTREKARKSGMAFVTVRNGEHYGAASYWAERIAQDDMIAFSSTNCEPLMAPPGGKKVALGTNPVCVCVPTASYGNVCLDIATSMVAQGKLFDYKLRHRELGQGWAVDENGIPTTDPEKAVYLTPFAAHKGYGLAVIVEILCSVLSGGGIGSEIHSLLNEPDKPNNVSFCFMGMRIDAFRDPEEFRKDMDRFVEYLHATPAAEGARVLFPGEIEMETKKRNEASGFEIPESLADDLKEIAEKLGIRDAGQYFTA